MCNHSNGWARRHGRGDVGTRKFKRACGGNSDSFLSFSKSSVCQFTICLSVLFTVVCPISCQKPKTSIRARAGCIIGCVFLPARTTLRVGIHTVCVLSAWERSTRSRLSRELAAINSVVDRFQEARKQAEAFQRFLPRRSLASGAAGREQLHSYTGSSHWEQQKQSVASRAPPQQGREQRRSRSGSSKSKPDLRTVLLTKKDLAKKP